MFSKGQSGNPAGRPKGIGRIGELRNSIHQHVPDIINAMVAQAKAGDVLAAKLLLEKVLPPMKADEATIQFNKVEGLIEQGNEILRAVADGEIAPTQASSILTGLGSLARIKEIDELEKRITKLENHNNELEAED